MWICYGLGFVVWPLICAWGPATNEWHWNAWSLRTAARWKLFTPVWPIGLGILILMLFYRGFIWLSRFFITTWKVAEISLLKSDLKEQNSGQVSLDLVPGGELSNVVMKITENTIYQKSVK